jgi:hypothetical protein
VSDEDPFGTAAIRAAVLAAWQASPARFREDANAEEDLALGAYRDRVVVELAQNAADAAARAGVPGRLLLRLTPGPRSMGGPRLLAANTGAPLDAAGVQALATLRASAKREGASVGRFGVGFAAVLGVSDEPLVTGRSGGVRFSAAASADAVRSAASASPGLAGELARRRGHVPVLRLPWPAATSLYSDADPGVNPDRNRAGDASGAVGLPDDYDTLVDLPLRDAAAERAVRAQLDALDDGLLLALPALDEVVVELPGERQRRLRDVGTRWRVVRREGTFAPELLADRPTEERERSVWSVTWAVPLDTSTTSRPPAVVHAPTPSEEPLPWPALLVATFPLEPSRRHVAPGPATDALVASAAAGYVALLAQLAAEPGDAPAGHPVTREPWRLVPTGLSAGALDGALRAALADLLPGTPFLRSAEDPAVALRPRDAVALEPPAGSDPDAVGALAPVVAGLVLAPRAAAAAFDVAGVRRAALADIVEQLPPPPSDDGWHRLYRGLEQLAADAAAREALAALPVPLADGRVVRSPRGVVLPVDAAPGRVGGKPAEELAAALAVLRARVVRAGVAADEGSRRLLERLGAQPTAARDALELPAVTGAVATAADAAGEPGGEGEGMAGTVRAVLTLVRQAVDAGALRPGDLPALAALPLPDADGDVTPAGTLVLPSSAAARLLDEDEVGLVDPDLLAEWGRETLAAVGVAAGLTVLRGADVPLDAPPDDDLEDALEGVAEWLHELAGRASARFGSSLGAVVAELVAVRDLDLVRDDAWPEALHLIARDPVLRAALLTPVRLTGPAGGAVDAPSYTAWWLRSRLAGGGAWADPDAYGGLAALLPPAPAELAGADPAVRAALGAVRDPGDLDADAVADVLDGLADPDVVVDAATALRTWAALAGLHATLGTRGEGERAEPPQQVRVLAGDGTVVVDADEACVVGDPMHAQRGDLGGFVVAPGPERAAALADLFDLPLAEDLADGVVEESGGRLAEVPPAVHELVPAAPRRWCEHDELGVDGAEVDWWVDGPAGGEAIVHAVTLDALARGLAWAGAAWASRGALAEVLLDPSSLAGLLLDEAFSAGPYA